MKSNFWPCLGLKAVLALCVLPGTKGIAGEAPSEETCFSRQYNSKHLSDHPNQLVRSISLKVRPLPPHPRNADTGAYAFSISMSVRGSTSTLRTSGYCKWKEGKSVVALRCIVDCDGGGVNLEFPREGALLIHLGGPLGPGHIRLSNECDSMENKDVELVAGLDDKLFLLGATSLDTCEPDFLERR
jgi:hypothetical protein